MPDPAPVTMATRPFVECDVPTVTTLSVALIGGPQYAALDPAIARFSAETGVEVEVAFRGDHPSLNAHLAETMPAGVPYDLVSTHGKYAPAQSRWLRPLDGLVDVGAFRPGPLRLCSFEGRLLCVPRNIDVRLLWWRRDLMAAAPVTWDQLASVAQSLASNEMAGFAFPARDSGLFGTFFELTVAFGGQLFGDDGKPRFDDAGARQALAWLVDAVHQAKAPADWYFDEVSAGLRDGTVAMAGDWPGYYGLLDGSPAESSLDVARYPSGPAGRAVYAGSHGFAVPTACVHPDEALQLLAYLTSRDSAAGEAAAGMVPARNDVDLPRKHALDQRRADLLDITIAEDMLHFPPIESYPEIEEAAAGPLHEALTGRLSVDEALSTIERKILS
jgi:multiple sugar transport system substrate-binding protein